MKRNGFTLVELLVVIAIIAVLVGLLLPAVYGARESARRLTCTNHIRQLATGCLNHETAHGFFPNGGWNNVWVGDPNAGIGMHQPGGWIFNVLPYIDQTALHDKGLGKRDTALRNALTEMVQTPIAVMNCPTRRKADICNNIKSDGKPRINPYNTNENLQYFCRTDYAGNAGSFGKNMYTNFPDTGKPNFDQKVASSFKNWPRRRSDNPNQLVTCNGIFFVCSVIGRNDVTDGLSNTYMIGEKFVDAKAYNGVDECRGDNESMFVGADPDIIRWCYGNTSGDYDPDTDDATAYHPDDYLYDKNTKEWIIPWPYYSDPKDADKNSYSDKNQHMPPLHDINNVPQAWPWKNYFWRFGSAHASSMNMAFADASVHRVHYGIEGRIHALLGSRKDRQMIPDTKEIK